MGVGRTDGVQYCLSDKPQLKEFEPVKTSVQEYPITTYQPVYFVAESFEDAKSKLRSGPISILKSLTPCTASTPRP